MFEYLSPRQPYTSQDIAEILELQKVAQDFRLEVDYREQFEAYCAWYYQTARQHQQELAQMAGDPDILSWFRGSRGTSSRPS